MNPMADAPDAREWFDVHVEQIAGHRPLMSLSGGPAAPPVADSTRAVATRH